MVHIATVILLLSVKLPEVLHEHSTPLVKHIPRRKKNTFIFYFNVEYN